MKKKISIKNILNWFKDAWLKAIVVFLIVAGGFYTYAAITWPGSDPNPTTGVVGMFMGASSTGYSSGIDYDTANGYCEADYPGSHICTGMEMINSYNHAGPSSPITTYSGSNILWINVGAPGNIVPAVSDCKGWTDRNNSPYYGTVWNFTLEAAGLQPCGSNKNFACCK